MPNELKPPPTLEVRWHIEPEKDSNLLQLVTAESKSRLVASDLSQAEAEYIVTLHNSALATRRAAGEGA